MLKQKLKVIRNRIFGSSPENIEFIKNLLIKQNEQNLNALFDVVYEANLWGNGSGTGSDEKVCAGYVAFLQDFFKKHNIKSIVDAGCGDWQFSKNIDFSGIDYQGFDVASFVIRANSKKYAKDNVKFNLYDGDFNKLPSADLLICRDVLMHLPNAKIKEFIAILPKFKYALITNDTGDVVNDDILPTQRRDLDLRAEPFNLPCEKVFELFDKGDGFGTHYKNIKKPTMLWTNPNISESKILCAQV